MHFELDDLPPKMREQAEKQLREQQRRAQERAGQSDPYGDPLCNGYKPMPEPPVEPPDKKASKYRNIKEMRSTPLTMISFDSKKEARRYDELMLMLAAGIIRNLKLQPQFTLQEAHTKPNGERVRAIRYQADFSYERPTEPDKYGNVHWLPVVEDVKSAGTRTRVYEIKKKLMYDRLGIEITEA